MKAGQHAEPVVSWRRLTRTPRSPYLGGRCQVIAMRLAVASEPMLRAEAYLVLDRPSDLLRNPDSLVAGQLVIRCGGMVCADVAGMS
jgi:hypothetical protein